MNTRTFVAAALASVFAVTAAAPSFAAADPAKGDPAKHEKRVQRMIDRADTDKDGRVSPAEMQAALEKGFDVLDTNHDGMLSKAELDNRRATFKAYREQARAGQKDGRHLAGMLPLPRAMDKRFDRIDTNHDGSISKTELAGVGERIFKRRDHDKDGYISAADFKA